MPQTPRQAGQAHHVCREDTGRANWKRQSEDPGGLINCRVLARSKHWVSEIPYRTLVSSPIQRALSMVSIMLRASEHWSKVNKTKESQSSATSRDRSKANNAASLGDDTGNSSLQANRAEVAPNDPISPPFKPLSWKFRSGCDDSGRIVTHTEANCATRPVARLPRCCVARLGDIGNQGRRQAENGGGQ